MDIYIYIYIYIERANSGPQRLSAARRASFIWGFDIPRISPLWQYIFLGEGFSEIIVDEIIVKSPYGSFGATVSSNTISYLIVYSVNFGFGSYCLYYRLRFRIVSFELLTLISHFIPFRTDHSTPCFIRDWMW